MIQLRRKPRGRKCKSYAQVADILEAEGLKTRKGGPWNRGSVHAILNIIDRRKKARKTG